MRSEHSRLLMTLLAMFALLTPSTPSPAQCTRDIDCKGDRVCVNGICIDPPVRAPQPSTPPERSHSNDAPPSGRLLPAHCPPKGSVVLLTKAMNDAFIKDFEKCDIVVEATFYKMGIENYKPGGYDTKGNATFQVLAHGEKPHAIFNNSYGTFAGTPKSRSGVLFDLKEGDKIRLRGAPIRYSTFGTKTAAVFHAESVSLQDVSSAHVSDVQAPVREDNAAKSDVSPPGLQATVPFRTGEAQALALVNDPISINSVEIKDWPSPEKLRKAQAKDDLAAMTALFRYSNSGDRDWLCVYRVTILDDKDQEIGSGERQAKLDKRQTSDTNGVKVNMRASAFERATKIHVAVEPRPK